MGSGGSKDTGEAKSKQGNDPKQQSVDEAANKTARQQSVKKSAPQTKKGKKSDTEITTKQNKSVDKVNLGPVSCKLLSVLFEYRIWTFGVIKQTAWNNEIDTAVQKGVVKDFVDMWRYFIPYGYILSFHTFHLIALTVQTQPILKLDGT